MEFCHRAEPELCYACTNTSDGDGVFGVNRQAFARYRRQFSANGIVSFAYLSVLLTFVPASSRGEDTTGGAGPL
jgi:hypothetical protein